ncbi:hypothetical protein OC835_008014, partial [Tilletia horrida]
DLDSKVEELQASVANGANGSTSSDDAVRKAIEQAFLGGAVESNPFSSSTSAANTPHQASRPPSDLRRGQSISLGPFGGAPDAIAVLSLSDVPDDEERDVKIPILVGDDLGTLARNYIDETTAAKHKFEQVGHLLVKLRIDPGLSDDHEDLAQQGGKQRHEYEVYNRLEGMPARAEENAQLGDENGKLSSEDKKKIADAKSEALHTRHRGSHGYTAVREGKW